MSPVEMILQEAVKLKPVERAALIKGLVNSMDVPDKKIEAMWIKESRSRLEAIESGKLETVKYEELFSE